MFFRTLRYLLVIVIMPVTICWRAVYAQTLPGPVSSGSTDLANALSLNTIDTAALDVYLKGSDGQPAQVAAVVTLLKLSNEAYRQETTKAGHVHFKIVPATEYSVQVVAPGYQTVVKQLEVRKDEVRAVTIELQQLSTEHAAENSKARAPKAQKEIRKALELLRAQKVADARRHLDAANRAAPNQAEVQYLYGIYAKQTGNAEQAKAYWMKAVEFSPKHFLALLSLADALLLENHETDALPYATRAVEVEPSSWRAHAVLANVYLHLGWADEAVQQAERAMELGHEQATIVQPVLAGALARKGEKEAATSVLQSYLKEHASDAEAKKLLDNLQLQTASVGDVAVEAGTWDSRRFVFAYSVASALPLPSNWLPPDVDDRVPPVEQGAGCTVENVVEKAGKRVQEFVKNVEHFTASEHLKHEAIDKWGMAGAAETRKFDYVVAIEEFRPGFLGVEEYRSGVSSASEFPDGVATNGLPALMLIFHPYDAVNFEMTCEGLTRWNGKPAWQIHFHQRRDKPNTVRAYRLGVNGPSYPVALKGRAWILADTFQVARLETDLIDPLPQIKLFADHTAIEYGPVRFKNRNVEMWLPQSAEVYYDWRGHRSHRRHSFSNYLLFAVDETQRISEPKSEN